MDDSTNPRARAIAALAEMFLDLAFGPGDFAAIESKAIDLGHGCMAEALGLALEAYDARLMGGRPRGLRAHDVRARTLATEIGDVSFSIRRYRDRFGCDACLLADALDIPYGARVSPGAAGFLVEAAAHVSYARAARLLARHGSRVRATTAMRCMREAGALCAEEDRSAAESLYGAGVVPEAELSAEEICMEADGTWLSLQRRGEGGPRRAEVKAVCAYRGKEARGKKVVRRNAVHHACIASPDEVWSEAVPAIGRRFDLAKIKRVHLGADGEAWCSAAPRFIPGAEVAFHLDPFHVNRAVLSCFAEPEMAWSVIDCIADGDKGPAIALLKACLDLGLAREKQARSAISYLEGNADAIAVDGPSLGTMGSENQHLYGVRMDSFPCAWSLRGASDMARIVSRRASGREVPRMTRERSTGARRARLREIKELSFYERGGSAGTIPQTAGSGYLPPHQADTGRMDAGKAYALRKGMANLDRRI